MPARWGMSSEARQEYLELMQERYRPAGRKERGALLGEMEEVTGLHRKEPDQTDEEERPMVSMSETL